MVVITAVIFIFSGLNAEPVRQGTPEDNPATKVLDKKEDTLNQEEKSNITQEEEELRSELDTYVRLMPSGKVDAQSGKVRLVETSLEYSYDFKVADKLPVTFLFNHKYMEIDETVAVPLPAHLTGLGMGLETTLPFFFNNTYLRLGAAPSFYSDDWHFRSSLFRMSGRLFLIYKPDDKWIYILGAGVWPNHNAETRPIIGFIYKPNDRLTYHVIPDNPNITYMMSDRVTVFVEAFGTDDEYEVTRGNQKNVVLRYRETHIGTGFQYKFNKFVQCAVSAGGMFNRYLKYKDGQGKVHIKDGLYTEFRLVINI